MNKIPFTYYMDWSKPAVYRPALMSEFADNGAENVVFDSNLVGWIASDASFRRQLVKDMDRTGLKFVDGHAAYSAESTFTAPDELRGMVIARSMLTLAIMADFGVKNCCFHVGKASEYQGMTVEEGRRNVRLALDAVLPYAEKLGVVIGLENIFHPLNNSAHVVELIKEYDSPNLGICFDCGHANIMENGKNNPNCVMYNRWGLVGFKPEEIIWETDVLGAFLPYIVMCHLHDNDGVTDQHLLPGSGTVDFKKVLSRLKDAPRLTTMQSEVIRGVNSVKCLCRTWEQVLKENW